MLFVVNLTRFFQLILMKNATGTGKDATVGLARGGKESRRRKRQRPLQLLPRVRIAEDGFGGFLQLTLIQETAFLRRFIRIWRSIRFGKLLPLGRRHPKESFNESSRPFRRLRFSLSLLHRYLAALISAMHLIICLLKHATEARCYKAKREFLHVLAVDSKLFITFDPHEYAIGEFLVISKAFSASNSLLLTALASKCLPS